MVADRGDARPHFLVGPGGLDGRLPRPAAPFRPLRAPPTDYSRHALLRLIHASHGVRARTDRIDRLALPCGNWAWWRGTERSGHDLRIQPETIARDVRADHLLRLFPRLRHYRLSGRRAHSNLWMDVAVLRRRRRTACAGCATGRAASRIDRS